MWVRKYARPSHLLTFLKSRPMETQWSICFSFFVSLLNEAMRICVAKWNRSKWSIDKRRSFSVVLKNKRFPLSFQVLKRLSNSTKQKSLNRMKRLSSSVPAQAGFAVLPVQKQFRRRGAPPWTLHREHRLGRVAHLPQPAAVPAKVYPPTKIRATKSIFLHDEPLSRLNYSEPMFRLKKYTLSSIWVSFQSALIQAAGESTMTLQFMFITYHEMRKVHYWRLAAVRTLQDDRRSSGKYFWSFIQKNTWTLQLLRKIPNPNPNDK